MTRVTHTICFVYILIFELSMISDAQWAGFFFCCRGNCYDLGYPRFDGKLSSAVLSSCELSNLLPHQFGLKEWMKINGADWRRFGWSGLVLSQWAESQAGNGSTERVSHQDCRQCLENTPYGSMHVVLSVYSAFVACGGFGGWVLRNTYSTFHSEHGG